MLPFNLAYSLKSIGAWLPGGTRAFSRTSLKQAQTERNLAYVKASALKSNFADPSIRLTAEQRLHNVQPGPKPPRLKDLRSAVAELRIYEAELEIQNEELFVSRAQVEESQKKYFRHFDLAPCGLIRLNLQGRILEANILAAQMLGHERQLLNAVPQSFLVDICPESRGVFQQHLDSALTSGKMETCELSLCSRAGRETFVRIQSVMNRNEQGETDFYVTLTDLTEHREIEQKLAQQKIFADAAVASKELFFGMLSHELRTPLTPLVAVLAELESEPDRSPEDRAAFAMMRRNLDLETHLIDDLLDLTRMTGGKLLLECETIDLHLCLTNAIAICRDEIAAKGLDLVLDLDADSHFVNGDASRLQQVFWNLIKNAVKFTAAPGQIIISSRRGPGARVIVDFCDTGIGIDWWTLAQVFNPFYQVDPKVKQRTGGLGLGLAICKSITEAHAGTLIATSDGLGHGTTFTLELPTADEPDAELPGLDYEISPASRRDGLRLLIVEDHDDTRRILTQLLRRRGYEVESARDCPQARILCAQNSFDLLISDLQLGQESGNDLLRELQSVYGLRGIAMSGCGSDVDLDLSKQAGFLEHLVKPVDAKTLDAAIQRLCASLT